MVYRTSHIIRRTHSGKRRCRTTSPSVHCVYWNRTPSWWWFGGSGIEPGREYGSNIRHHKHFGNTRTRTPTHTHTPTKYLVTILPREFIINLNLNARYKQLSSVCMCVCICVRFKWTLVEYTHKGVAHFAHTVNLNGSLHICTLYRRHNKNNADTNTIKATKMTTQSTPFRSRCSTYCWSAFDLTLIVICSEIWVLTYTVRLEHSVTQSKSRQNLPLSVSHVRTATHIWLTVLPRSRWASTATHTSNRPRISRKFAAIETWHSCSMLQPTTMRLQCNCSSCSPFSASVVSHLSSAFSTLNFVVRFLRRVGRIVSWIQLRISIIVRELMVRSGNGLASMHGCGRMRNMSRMTTEWRIKGARSVRMMRPSEVHRCTWVKGFSIVLLSGCSRAFLR